MPGTNAVSALGGPQAGFGGRTRSSPPASILRLASMSVDSAPIPRPTHPDAAVAAAPAGAPAVALDLDALVDATPASRDRVVDLLRATSICVVVLWHWTATPTWPAGRP